MSFIELFEKYSWEDIQQRIYSVTTKDVCLALAKRKCTVEDFLILISPAATPFLEEMAYLTQQLTQQRFGKTIQLYAPLYVSNECNNICTYCGFSFDNKIKRRTLTDTELLREAEVLKKMGVEHILLVSGESNHIVGQAYFLNALKILQSHFTNISIEVQPLSIEQYTELQQAGTYAVMVYQETYHKEVYKTYHPKGKKSNFNYRLDTPDRIGQANIHKIGLGVLLGLEDWRIDSFFTALHIDYLQKKYWKSKYSVSFPRLRPAQGIIEPNFVMNDRDLLQLICAYRIWNFDLEISISTRESAVFRNNVIGIGATSMSAGSKTNPGGYTTDEESLEQFEINDERPMEVFREIIKQKGYDPVMKDWDKSFSI
ncbi:thiamine biosynthesis protein ThiH [Capnocytophaga stomatis]|uniref:2-iminoacetate synthase ThiH n=1 Tax=Capnocytophaga stomatis TaxID=1848904 RepID=UPI00194E41D1|nr:2-iminoacetate synthase ThiH [Capnocytophaga stomatis]GIJ95874.1 thiamine biosynthesis protein ThiH [Capnocytophaga stomatis]